MPGKNRFLRSSTGWIGPTAFLLAAVSLVAAPGGHAAEGPNWHSADQLSPDEDAVTSSPEAKPSPSPDQKASPGTEAELLVLAKQGNADAENRLGVMYLVGKVVPKNVAEGVKWLRAAADQGHHAAQLNVGTLYANGIGVPKDFVEASKWYQRSADQGDAGGQVSLGYLYEHGLGTVQNFAQALFWYRKAADQNNVVAQYDLATMYEKGEGVPKDETEALRLIRIAAEKGFAPAQINLALRYFSGKTVTRDPSLSYFWSALGAAHAPANQAALATSVRDGAARLLAVEELTRLQELAAKWKPGMDVAALIGPTPPTGPGGNGPATGMTMTGTGFVVAKEGFVLTNAHVVPGCKSVKVRLPDGTTNDASVANRDERSDLALLKLPGSFPHVSTFREDRGIRQGDSILAYGFPLTGLLSDQGNLTVGTVSALAGTGNDTHVFQISAPVQPGNSGGPVVDASGNVVGVVVSKLNALGVAQITGDMTQNINFAIKEGVARDFLEANGVAYLTAKSTKEIKPADLGEHVRQFTVLVSCGQ